MIFVYVCWTWSIVEFKTRFETWITRNDLNGLRLFHLPYVITLMAYLCSQRRPKIQITYFMFDWSIYRLFVPNTRWTRDSLQLNIFVNIYSTWSIVELVSRFETWITRNHVNGVSLFHLFYLITLMAYLCSHRTPKVQIEYFMFDWSIYRLFVLNTGWKRDSFQMMKYVNVYWTLSIVELKTRFETWITWNDVSGVSLFPLFYFITRLTCVHKGHQMSKSSILCLIGRSRLLVLNRGWKHDYLQVLIFVNVCSTWSMVELKTLFETCITRNDVNVVSLYHLSYLLTLTSYLCS
jgi:hypothetical protein